MNERLPINRLREELWFLPAAKIEKIVLEDDACYLTVNWGKPLSQERSDAMPLPDPEKAPKSWRLN